MMLVNQITKSVLSTLLIGQCALAQVKTNNPLKSYLDSVVDKGATAYMATPGTVGLAIGIYRNGVSHFYSYGESKKGTRQLIRADQYFNLGSVAKTYVGTMLAEAVIEKKANLNDDIRKYLPGNYPNLAYNGHPVRLVDIANHTSGMPPSPRNFPAWVMDSLAKLPLSRQITFYSTYNQDSLLKDMHHFKIDTIPGTKYRYNGNAMMVLTLLLEHIYNQPYEQLVTHYLKTHLQLYDTRTQVPAGEFNRFVQGYDAHGVPQRYVNTKMFYGGPSMNSTMNDMLQYLKVNVEENDPAIVLTHQVTWGNPKDFALGLNWMLDLENGKKDYYHAGHTGIGFNTLCEFYPEEHLGIMIVVNDNISQDKLSALENAIKKNL
jgi:CubicO group peptidase (beta-lactamase class C family)